MAYVCFIVDAFSRRIVGWRVTSHMRTDMVLDALEMARRSRGNRRLVGLVAHSDAGMRARRAPSRITGSGSVVAAVYPGATVTPPVPSDPQKSPVSAAFVGGRAARIPSVSSLCLQRLHLTAWLPTDPAPLG